VRFVGFGQPRSGDREFVNRIPLAIIVVAPSGLDYVRWLTQGSQSLALGLTLTAATQLVIALERPG